MVGFWKYDINMIKIETYGLAPAAQRRRPQPKFDEICGQSLTQKPQNGGKATVEMNFDRRHPPFPSKIGFFRDN